MTRDPVPSRILKMWRPVVSSKKGSTSKESEPDFEATSVDNTEDESFGSKSPPLQSYCMVCSGKKSIAS